MGETTTDSEETKRIRETIRRMYEEEAKEKLLAENLALKRLHNSAPELLEMLEDIVAYITLNSYCMPTGYEEVVKMGEKLINKVKG